MKKQIHKLTGAIVYRLGCLDAWGVTKTSTKKLLAGLPIPQFQSGLHRTALTGI